MVAPTGRNKVDGDAVRSSWTLPLMGTSTVGRCAAKLGSNGTLAAGGSNAHWHGRLLCMHPFDGKPLTIAGIDCRTRSWVGRFDR